MVIIKIIAFINFCLVALSRILRIDGVVPSYLDPNLDY